MPLSDEDKAWLGEHLRLTSLADVRQVVREELQAALLRPEDPTPEPEPLPQTPEPELDTQWKITLPVADDGGYAKEVYPAQFFPPYFRRGQDGLVFRCPVGGATTKGSSYPRSELREMRPDGKLAAWTNKPGGGSHHLKIEATILAIPTAKPHIVVAQIHDDEDDVIMIRLERKHLFVEWDDGKNGATLDYDYNLGTRFTVAMWAGNGLIHASYNGSLKFDKKITVENAYFKAGAYVQSNPSKGDNPETVGEVVIHDLVLTHH